MSAAGGRLTGGRAMSDTALIVIDMLNSYDHEDAELLLPSVRRPCRTSPR